jgi:tRNA uridine 5-carboxymethylaminomethyl modification enzyme
VRPGTLAQAGRIEGMTPAALMLIAAHVKRRGPAKKPSDAKGRSDAKRPAQAGTA